mmetsp:Transcript_34827/g.88256  ORF Transcript_34827/g.88256 Transcript_34827/m.88256 type:complete len:913 (-) Transcript_34827:778-3516(-)
MFQLHNKIMALSVDDPAIPGRKATFLDLCYRGTDNKCQLDDGYLWYWLKDFTLFLQDVGGSATDPAAGNYTAFKERVSSTTYPDGQPVSLLSVFGGTTFSFDPFQLQAAQIIASDYTLDEAVDKDVAKLWHDAFTDLMKAELPQLRYMSATWITGSTVGEELGKAINNDMMLVIISLLVYIVIAVLVLARWDRVRARTALALAGILVTGLGLMSGWGWGMIFGMPFTPLQQLSPFILLGMGIDVVFILQKSYDIIVEREPWLAPPEAFARLMSTAGLSVQVTLLASAVAFALGSVDELNSVKWFSAFSALNTLMILVLMMTMFVACMVITERRIAANRLDCLCCITSSQPAPASPAQPQLSAELSTTITKHATSDDLKASVALSLPPTQAIPPMDAVKGAPGAGSDSGARDAGAPLAAIHDDDVADENMVKRFFRKYYAPFLGRWYIKVLVLCLFAAWGAASWYGIYQVQYGQPLSDLAPDGSYLQDYDAVQQATYQQQVGEPVGLYFRDIDVSQPEVQYKMFASLATVLDNKMFNASTSAFLGNWLITFTLWAQGRGETVPQATNNCYNPYVGRVVGNLAGVIFPRAITGCVPAARFYPLLAQWQAEQGASSSVIMQGGRVLTSRMSVMQIAKADDDRYENKLMNEVRDLEKALNDAYFGGMKGDGGTYASFIYGGSYVFNEGDRLLPKQTMIYFILALVGVFVVTTFMLVNPVASLLLAAAVGLVGLYLFGELWALQIRFNQVSVINMIMATGLSVDYCVYTAQKFMTVAADGTGNGRMLVALSDTGSAVFLGGMTALLGSVPMAFSKSVIIRTFFKLIFGTVLFSMLVGLILVPVVLSILAPPPVRSALIADGHPAPVTLPPAPTSSQQQQAVGETGEEAERKKRQEAGSSKEVQAGAEDVEAGPATSS